MALLIVVTIGLGIIRKVFTTIAGTLMKAVFSKKMILTFFIMFGDWIVLKTSPEEGNKGLDNLAWAKIKPELEKELE